MTQIYLADPRDGSLLRLPYRGVSLPSWSPDGSHLAFVMPTRVATGAWSALFVVNANGSGLHQVSHDAYVDPYGWMPQWSPDGRELLFADNDGSIYRAGSDGAGEMKLTRGFSENASIEASDFAWSPDGSQIVVTDYAGRPANVDLFVMRPDGTGRRDITNTPRLDELEPAWSPDGSRIAYIARPHNGYFDDVWTVSSDGGQRHDLTNSPRSDDLEPRWSPDGSRLAFLAGGALWVTGPLALSSDAPVISGRLDVQHFAWSPDGTRFVVESGRFGRYGFGNDDIFVAGPGNRLRKMSADPLDDTMPAWQPLPEKATPAVPLAATEPPSLPPAGALTFACGVGEVRADFDGDGHPDVALTYSRDRPGSPGCNVDELSRPHRRIRIYFSSGGSFDEPLACTPGYDRIVLIEGCWPEFGLDLNRDGRDELALNVENGSAHDATVALFRVDASGLHRILAPGQPGELAQGEFDFAGGASDPEAIVCRTLPDGRHLVIQRGGNLPGQGPATIYDEEFVYDGSELHFFANRQYTTGEARAEHLFSETASCPS